MRIPTFNVVPAPKCYLQNFFNLSHNLMVMEFKNIDRYCDQLREKFNYKFDVKMGMF